MNNAKCHVADDLCLESAEVAVLPIVLDLDGVHAELSTARVLACPPPSDRWHRLAMGHLEAATGDPPPDPDARIRSILISGAAFLLTEVADLTQQAGLLRPGPIGDRTRCRLREIADDAEGAAQRLLDRAESPDPLGTTRTPAPAAQPDREPVDDARRVADLLGATIDVEEARGSLRHRPVSTTAKILSFVAVLAVDLPITLWLSSQVLAENGSPSGAAAVWSVVVAVVATAGVVILPYQLGREFRVFVSPDRHLRWVELPPSSRLVVAGAALLISAVSVGVLLSVARLELRPDLLNAVLTVLVVLALPVGAGMAFRLALRDGSPERDELVSTSRLVRRRRLRRRRIEDQVVAADFRLRLARCVDRRERRAVELEATTAFVARVLTEPVLGPRGHLLTVEQAQRRLDELRAVIARETADGDARHRRVGWRTRIVGRAVPVAAAVLTLPAVPIAWAKDVPGLPAGPLLLVGCVAIAVGGFALHHMGRDLRHHKGADRRLHPRVPGYGTRSGLVGITLLGGLLAAAALVSVHRLLGGSLPDVASWTAAALPAAAVLVAIVAVVATAFLDGSPETDDVLRLERLLARYVHMRQGGLARAADLRAELMQPTGPGARRAPTTRWLRLALRAERRASLVSLVVVAVCALGVALAHGTLGYGQTLAFVAVLTMPVLVVWRAWRWRRPPRSGARRLDRLPDADVRAGFTLTAPGFPTADGPPRPGPGLDWATRT